MNLEQFNTFMGSGALGTTSDDFNGDNFDHSKEKFLHGDIFIVFSLELALYNKPHFQQERKVLLCLIRIII